MLTVTNRRTFHQWHISTLKLNVRIPYVEKMLFLPILAWRSHNMQIPLSLIISTWFLFCQQSAPQYNIGLVSYPLTFLPFIIPINQCFQFPPHVFSLSTIVNKPHRTDYHCRARVCRSRTGKRIHLCKHITDVHCFGGLNNNNNIA